LKGRGRYSLGRSSRDHLSNNGPPGPGSYESNVVPEKRGKITFGKDNKLKGENTYVPGPGQYDLKPTFADVPKYLLPDKA